MTRAFPNSYLISMTSDAVLGRFQEITFDRQRALFVTLFLCVRGLRNLGSVQTEEALESIGFGLFDFLGILKRTLWM